MAEAGREPATLRLGLTLLNKSNMAQHTTPSAIWENKFQKLRTPSATFSSTNRD